MTLISSKNVLYCIKMKIKKPPDCFHQTVQQRTGTYGFITVQRPSPLTEQHSSGKFQKRQNSFRHRTKTNVALILTWVFHTNIFWCTFWCIITIICTTQWLPSELVVQIQKNIPRTRFFPGVTMTRFSPGVIATGGYEFLMWFLGDTRYYPIIWLNYFLRPVLANTATCTSIWMRNAACRDLV
jgi:hypothetical protein